MAEPALMRSYPWVGRQAEHKGRATEIDVDWRGYRQGRLPHRRLEIAGKIALRRKLRRLILRMCSSIYRAAFRYGGLSVGAFCQSSSACARFEPRIIPVIYVKPFMKARRTTTMMKRPWPRPRFAPISRRCREIARSARPAGLSSDPLPSGLPADGNDQPNPRTPDRAGNRSRSGPNARRNALPEILRSVPTRYR